MEPINQKGTNNNQLGLLYLVQVFVRFLCLININNYNVVVKIPFLFNHYKEHFISTKPQSLYTKKKKKHFHIKFTNGNDFVLKIEFPATNFPIISLIRLFAVSHKTAGYRFGREQHRLEPTHF